MSYYSSNGVDRFIEPLLPEIGMACDVGANDGKFYSNTLHFEEKGWTVLCIEPNPLLAESGRAVRKLWREVACAAQDGEQTFWARGPYPYASGSAIHQGRGESERGEPFMVRVLRLDRALEEAGFSRLDLLSVDVEQSEPEVMAGFTIERWQPTIIVLESVDNSLPTPQGYALLKRYEHDNVYRRIEP